MLRAEARLQDLLSHLYILVPVLDDDKHYWVGTSEIDKLLEKGKDWLPDHPERELISRRYLKHQRYLTREALARLSEEDDPDPELTSAEHADEEKSLEDKISLNEQRIGTVVSVLRESGARSVEDLGCGEGKLLRTLLESRSASGFDFDRILGMDVSHRSLAWTIHEDVLQTQQLGSRRCFAGSGTQATLKGRRGSQVPQSAARGTDAAEGGRLRSLVCVFMNSSG